jgi:hypothetical protein
MSDMDCNVHPVVEKITGIDPKLDLDLKRRVKATECWYLRRQSSGREDGNTPHTQSILYGLVGERRRIRCFHGLDCVYCSAVERFAFGREHILPVGASKQKNAQPILDARDQFADRRRRQRQIAGRCRETPVFDGSHECGHFSETVHFQT